MSKNGEHQNGDEVGHVALLALVYRELAEWGATGAPESGNDLYDDLEAVPGNVSLLRMIGSAALPEFDWTLVKALSAPETIPELLKEVAKVDPLRAEALAHAAELPTRNLLQLRRWARVERAMDELRATGLTATQDEVFERYMAARLAQGASIVEVLDDYYASTERID
jgi:hypothetical protein